MERNWIKVPLTVEQSSDDMFSNSPKSYNKIVSMDEVALNDTEYGY